MHDVSSDVSNQGQAETAFPVTLLQYLGGLMLPVAAIGLTYATRDRAGRRDYWRRIVEFKRIGAGWYAIILFTVPLLTAMGALLDLMLGGIGAQLEAAARFLDQPAALLPFAAFMLLFGPLPEEIAWRGYALDCLQTRWNALASSLILGAVWTLWHLPLFFIEGTYQHGLSGTLSFWLFLIDKPAQSIVATWIYNHNQCSTLSAVLLHFAVNFVGQLFELTQRAEVFYILLWVVMAMIVTVIWGPRTLTRRRQIQEPVQRNKKVSGG